MCCDQETQSSSQVKKSPLDYIQIFVGIGVSVVALISAWQLHQAEGILKHTESQVKLREAARKDAEEQRSSRESAEKRQLLIYDAVVKSLDSGNAKRQEGAKALVISMADEPLRQALLTVLTTSDSPEVKQSAERTLLKENQFRDESLAISSAERPTAGGWHDWDFDIFWCEQSGSSAKQQAEAIVAQLAAENAKGRLRVRELPTSVNARSGYQHSGFVIRANDNEKTQADKLKQLAERALNMPESFVVTASSQPTPWYISAFICPKLG